MATYLIKFTLKEADPENQQKKQVLLPNKKKGGLPQDFLIQIPYFGALMANSFSDSLKPNPEVNQMDLTSLELSAQDLVSYLTHRKAFSDQDPKIDLFKPTPGVLRLAHFLQDRELMIHFGQKYQFDYQTYLEFDEGLLSELAGEYLNQTFKKAPHHHNLVRWIENHEHKLMDAFRKMDHDFDTGPLLTKLKGLKSAVIELSEQIDQSELWKPPTARWWYSYGETDTNKKVSDHIDEYLESIDLVIEQVSVFDCCNRLQGTFLNEFFGNMFHFADDKLAHYLTLRQETWSMKIRKFVNQNPGMAKLIWETEDFRSELLRAYLKVSNRKYRRYFEAMFEDLIPLVENRIGPNVHLKVDQALAKILREDGELARLHNKYNCGEEEKTYLHYVSPEDNERLEITWNQIVARKKFLTDRYNANRQKNAPRGPVKAGWYL